MRAAYGFLITLALVGVLITVMNVTSEESEAVERYSGKINFDSDEVIVYYGGNNIEPMYTINQVGLDIVVLLKTGYENVTINGTPYNVNTDEVYMTASMRDEGVVIETDKIQYNLLYQGISTDNNDQLSIPTFVIGSDISVMMPVITRNGYDMTSWNTSENGSGVTVFPGTYHVDTAFIESIFSTNTTENLYPIWVAKTYSVTLETERGTISDASWSNTDGKFNRSFTVESAEFQLPSPVSDDRFHDFVCWKDSDGKTVYKIETGTYSNISLTAVWKNHDYSVSFTVNGRTYDGTYTIDDTIADPECEPGFSFKGWFFIDQEGNEAQFTEMSQMYEGISIYAVFEPIKEDPSSMAIWAVALSVFFVAVMAFAFTRK